MTWGSTIYKHAPAELARIRKLLAEARAEAAHPTEPTPPEVAARRKAGAAAIADRIGTAIATSRRSLARVRAEPVAPLTPATRDELQATADVVALELDAVERLTPTTGAWNAAVNLETAAGRLAAVVTSPWVDLRWIGAAQQLLSAAHAQRCEAVNAGRVQAKRRKDKPATGDDSDVGRNARIRRHYTRLVEQNHKSPTSQTATDFDVSRSTVQRARRNLPR